MNEHAHLLFDPADTALVDASKVCGDLTQARLEGFGGR